MHPRKNTEDPHKLKDEGTDPLTRAMNSTGYELEDISVLTCIPMKRLREIRRYENPSECEIDSLKMVLPLLEVLDFQ
jgi:hypothetical protein